MTVKLYDVSGVDLFGDGRPAPAGTLMRLTDDQAKDHGVKPYVKPASADPKAKPAKPAATRKRPAPRR